MVNFLFYYHLHFRNCFYLLSVSLSQFFIRDGKEPSLLEFGSVWVLPNLRVRSVRVLSSYGKMKVRFWFGSLCAVFGSVRFYTGSYPYWPSLHLYKIYIEYTVGVKKSTSGFVAFFPNGWEFSPNFICLLFFLFTIDYKFLFNCDEVMALSATTRHAFRPMVDILSIMWTGCFCPKCGF